MIKITFNADVRCFKQGDQFEFNLDEHPIIYIVGDNATGKSTLLNSIRTTKHTIANESLALEKVDFKNVSVEGLDAYDKIFCLSSEVDDPVNMYNACDAVAYIENGGYGQRRLSNGQKSGSQIGRFVERIKKEKAENDKVLIILDEVDKGLDLNKQIAFNTMLLNMAFMFNADIICVTHNPIPWMCANEVFYIKDKKFYKSNEYIKERTGIENFINEIPKDWNYRS